jgi:hypothetical protein
MPRKRLRVPRVLLRDPWPTHANWVHQTQARQACLQLLRDAGPDAALTADEVYNQLRSLAGPQASTGQPPLLLSIPHTRSLLEHLRAKRLIYGSYNPACDLPQGHPDYQYRYTGLPFQLPFRGSPLSERIRQEKEQKKAVEQAKKRLRRGKTPYPIFRHPARASVYQHALAYEQVHAAAGTVAAELQAAVEAATAAAAAK